MVLICKKVTIPSSRIIKIGGEYPMSQDICFFCSKIDVLWDFSYYKTGEMSLFSSKKFKCFVLC